MSRSMFPFNDSFRVTFTGYLLPWQDPSGAIVPADVPDPRFEKLDLQDAPKIPSWREKKKVANVSCPSVCLSQNVSSTTEPNHKRECVPGDRKSQDNDKENDNTEEVRTIQMRKTMPSHP
ncbi:unnamed protein product [Caenorhabditis sp. 36 PRJEB53466]|nr:unnamed protein product [Caenorhabditis sp. 36 PRJEB53466]